MASPSGNGEARFAIGRTDAVFGAIVRGIDLRQPIDGETAGRLRVAWVTHGVLVFPGQTIDDDDLERFTGTFGAFGDDPFFRPIAGRQHIAAIRRRADERTPIFAESWHSDWSFQAVPPAGTCLYGIAIPPHGGETMFANQQMALEHMPRALRARIADVTAVHSARLGYAPTGLYGAGDKGRSMDIVFSDQASAVQRHPLVRAHPETGRPGLFGCAGYIIALEGRGQDETLLRDLLAWQTRDEFVYAHRWQAGDLVMWDNRIVIHRATGGYDGYDRLLHRTTIADRTV